MEAVQVYKRRPVGTVVKNYTLSRHAAELLRELSPHQRGHGDFISSLIEAEYARREERQRLRQAGARTALKESSDA